MCWYNNLHKLISFLSHYTVLKIWTTHSCSHLQAGERTHLHKPSLKNPHRDACTRKPEADSHFIMGQKCSFINYTTHIYASLVHSRVSSPSLFFASLFLFIPLSSPLEVKLLSSQQRGQSVWPPLFVFSSSTICVCVSFVCEFTKVRERERERQSVTSSSTCKAELDRFSIFSLQVIQSKSALNSDSSTRLESVVLIQTQYCGSLMSMKGQNKYNSTRSFYPCNTRKSIDK